MFERARRVVSRLVTLERDGPVAVVTLNRPEALNALSGALQTELARVLAEAEADADVRAVVLTGAGERAFSAGLDLKELGADPGALPAALSDDPAANPVRALEACLKPVIGAINGLALTGGFELALACDVLIASPNARFADTHVRVGVMPGWGLSQKLSRAVGVNRARELSLSGNFLDAETACAWGLVSRVVQAPELLPNAKRLAADMASADPKMVAAMKALITEGFALTLNDAMDLERRVSSAHNSEVSAEAIERRRGQVQARGRNQ